MRAPLSLVALAAMTATAAARPPFDGLQHARLVPLLPVPAASVYVTPSARMGLDADGFLWNTAPSGGASQCLDPDAPTLRASPPVWAYGELVAVASRVGGAFYEQVDGSGKPVATRFVDCPALLADPDVAHVPPPLPFNRPLTRGLSRATIASDGTVCYVSNDELTDAAQVDCFDKNLDEPTLTRVLDGATLDEVLGIPAAPSDLAPTSNVPAEPEHWSFDDGQFGPDDRLYVLARRRTHYVLHPGPTALVQATTASFILRVEPSTGAVFVFARSEGALRTSHEGDPLGSATRLLFSTTLGALLADVPTPERNPVVGLGGLGFLVLPLDAPGVGLLSLSDAVARAGGCTQTCSTVIGTTPDGPLLADPRLAPGTVRVQLEPQRVELVADLLDLDTDGVLRGEELALGTSDYAEDSDGAGVPDGVELARGLDPTDGGDDDEDRWIDLAAAGAAQSLLIRLTLPPHLLTSADLVPAMGPDGPLCTARSVDHQGACTDARGAVVLTIDAGHDHVVSADGRALVGFFDDAIRGVDFSDGKTRELASAPELTSLLDGHPVSSALGPTRLLPLDGKRSYVVHPMTPPRVMFAEAGRPLATIFDLATQACTDLDACFAEDEVGVDSPYEGIARHVLPVGIVRGLLVVNVETAWREYLVAIAPDGATRVLDVAPVETLPEALVPRGDLLFGFGTQLARTDDGWAHVPVSFAVQTTALGDVRLPTGTFYAGTRAAAWGTLLTSSSHGPSNDLPSQHLFETVLLPRETEPGELLLHYRAGSEPTALYRGGRRGGLIRASTAILPELAEPDALNLFQAADGLRVCEVSTANDLVHEVDGPFFDSTPDLARERWRGYAPRPVDCAWDGAGRLVVLTEQGVVAREGDDGALAAVDDVPFATGARLLVARPDGTLEGFAPTTSAPGKGYTRDGRELLLTAGTLTVGGRAINLAAGAAAASPDMPFDFSVMEPTRLVERGDGRIVLVSGWAWLVDPASGRVAPFGIEGLAPHGRFAVVPGALPDPWQAGGGASSPAPPRPSVPIGGTRVTPEIASEADDGCAGGSPALALWLVAAVAAARWAVRLYERSRRVGGSAVGPRGVSDVGRRGTR